MKWEQIESDWKAYKPQLVAQWSKLTDEHLNSVGGKREKLATKIQEMYAISKEEAEKQIKAFEDRAKQPQAKILLLAVFPRGEKPTGKMGVANEKLKQVNATIAKLDDGKTVHFLDIGGRFPVVDGNLSAAAMPDFLHLSESGYQIWADAIGDKLAELMK